MTAWWHWSLAAGFAAGVMLALMAGSPAMFVLGFVGGALVGAAQHWVWRDAYRDSAARWARLSRAERRGELRVRTRSLRRGAAALAAVVAALLAALWLSGNPPGPQAVLLLAPAAMLYAAALYMDARGP